MNVCYRPMRQSDIPSGLSLCRGHLWNQLERDWLLFLELSPNSCLVATVNEKIIGTITTLSYQNFFSWIGMVLVDSAFQRRGIGKELLLKTLTILENKETIKLDATPKGQELYLKLDFKDEYPLVRMQANAEVIRLTDSPAKRLQKDELIKLFEPDQIIFGANRKAILHWLWEGAKEFAFILEESSSVSGYCMGRRGYSFIQIGPVIADNINYAKHLVAAAVSNSNGYPVILDALMHDPEWVHWLKEIGFTEQRHFIRMYKGVNRFPGTPEKQYAIAGPEYG